MNPQDQISATPSDRRSRARSARTEAARKRREEKAAARKFSAALRENSRGTSAPALGHEINQINQNASTHPVTDDDTDRTRAEPAGPPTAGFYANNRHTPAPDGEQAAIAVPRLVDTDADSAQAAGPAESGNTGADDGERKPAVSDHDVSGNFSERLAAASQAAQERVAQVRAEAQKHAQDAAQQRNRAEEMLETARIEADQLLTSAQADRARAAEELAEADRTRQQAASQAEQQAETIVDDAKAEAERIRAQAHEAAEARLNEVEQTAMEWLSAAEAEAERIARASFDDTAADSAPGEVGDQAGQAAPSKSS